MSPALPLSSEVPTAEDMRALGELLGRSVADGDVIVLSGDLGAGKTTLAQGIARGLGISDRVTSPTFVIARVHESPVGRPDLVHVDAYRLGSVVELDDLDLDADLGHCVVVVEWGEGLVEGLSPSWLQVMITRTGDEGDDCRTITITGHGPRWASASLG